MQIVKMTKKGKEVNCQILSQYDEEFARKTLDKLKVHKAVTYWQNQFAILFEANIKMCRLIVSLRDIEITSSKMNEIVADINAFLSACYKYSEATKKILIHSLPEKEINVNSKKGTTKGEKLHKIISGERYDNSFAYRLCVNLRNYIQHVGQDVISINSHINGADIEVYREAFLSKHTGMSPSLRKELEASTIEKYSLVIQFTNYYIEMQKFHYNFLYTLIDHYRDDLIDSSEFIVNNFMDLHDNSYYAIMDYKKVEDGAKFNIYDEFKYEFHRILIPILEDDFKLKDFVAQKSLLQYTADFFNKSG